MNLELNDLYKFVYDNYGQEPLQMKFEWQKDYLYYDVELGRIELGLLNYWTDDEKNGKQFISFSISKGTSGKSVPCDSYEELKEELDQYMKPKLTQISLF